MSILQRIGVVISTNINALLDKVEDPVATLEALITEIDRDYATAKREVTKSLADLKRIELKHEKALKEIEAWEKKAELAVAKKDDRLAREALKRMKENQQLADVYAAEIASQQEAVESLKSGLKALEAKTEEARRKKNILVAQHQRVSASKRLHETMSGISKKSGLASFDKIEDRIERMEAEAAAAKELTSDPIELEFARLEANDNLDDELAALKARIAKKKGKK